MGKVHIHLPSCQMLCHLCFKITVFSHSCFIFIGSNVEGPQCSVHVCQRLHQFEGFLILKLLNKHLRSIHIPIDNNLC